MNYLKVAFQLAKIIVAVIISLLYSSCINTALVANQPTLTGYSVGEKWVWKYKGVTTEDEVRSEGEDTKEIVSKDGVLGMIL
jgi:hypothetical protein